MNTPDASSEASPLVSLKIELVAPNAELATREFLELIPRDFARDHAVLSQGRDGEQEILAVTTKTAPDVVWNTGVRLGRLIRTVMVDSEALHRAIDAAYERGTTAVEALRQQTDQVVVVSADGQEDLDRLLMEADRDLLATQGKAPLVKLLDRLLFGAVQAGASDLHLQPTPDSVLIRHRVDGTLDQGRPIPPNVFRPLVSRIKVLGRMDVAERLVPQDGRTTVRIGPRTVDVRISTIPTAYGERVVLRLLDSSRQLFDAGSLGMPNAVATPFLAATKRSSGIVLVTGPTGSGKTTTLYATLRGLRAGELNIMTIEDPIEYELSSLGIPISQSQVNPKKGVNFANGLRHILRQDPDVIMVGEIRDAETARIAIQASLTGHLVLSTLHTNDAVSAVTRLIDLGVEPYLVSASLTVVLAQRLVRTCCATCSGSGHLGDNVCTNCHGSGFRGRCGIFEILPISEALRSAITVKPDMSVLRDLARQEGMRTLAESGAELVHLGRTTTAEVERVIHHG